MFSIGDFVYRNFDDVHTTDKDYNVACPFCDDVKHHLGIGISVQAVHCFRCGYSASWVGFVMKYTGFPFHRAIGELYVKPTMKEYEDELGHGSKTKLFSDRVEETEEESLSRLPKDFIRIDHAKGIVAERARVYLNARGFDESYWKAYGLGTADSVFGRVIIPIERGFWQGRRIFRYIEPKYINPASEARGIIFNSSALDKFSEIVVCEGAFSAMAVGANAIALIGKEPTDEKVERIIASKAETVIITIEPGAYPTMKTLADALYKNGRNVLLWKFLEGDPADPNGKFVEMEYNLKNRVSLQLENTLRK